MLMIYGLRIRKGNKFLGVLLFSTKKSLEEYKKKYQGVYHMFGYTYDEWNKGAENVIITTPGLRNSVYAYVDIKAGIGHGALIDHDDREAWDNCHR